MNENLANRINVFDNTMPWYYNFINRIGLKEIFLEDLEIICFTPAILFNILLECVMHGNISDFAISLDFIKISIPFPLSSLTLNMILNWSIKQLIAVDI